MPESPFRQQERIAVMFPPTPSHEFDNLVSTPKTNRQQEIIMAKLREALDRTHGRRSTHLDLTAQHNDELNKILAYEKVDSTISQAVDINGDDLSIADVVAVSCFNAPVQISHDANVHARVNESVDFLTRHLAAGKIVYGINTGYGGSADTRSTDLLSMQRGLIQHQNSAVLLSSDIGRTSTNERFTDLKSHALPRRVVRGSMLARCNSLLRGHSAVRLQVIQNIIELLNKDFIPIIPLRGSISASGDLMPLSYIAGALEGNTDIYLDCRISENEREVLDAREALQKAGIAPIVMMPKEGLGLMNGTAVSCAAASLALHETQYLALAAQVLTGMCTEALRGSADNYHPFISRARPHHGQMHVAENMRRMLEGSRLVVGTDARHAGLYQDRYGLRTSPQWIGPQVEDLALAWEQVEIELNSTTDNPLVDAQEQHVHHGGNFQAVSVTSAMEKARLALQMLGKLMFAQATELINPMLNNVLTPNLCFDDPDISFTFKGVDINMAAYMSELAFLANPVSSHIQSAEMHNQAVNSLALISTRYTMDAVELVSLMTAAYLYAVCQALDLHVLYIEYFTLLELDGRKTFDAMFGKYLTPETTSDVWTDILDAIRTGLAGSKSKDTEQRSSIAAEATVLPLTKALLASNTSCPEALQLINDWTTELARIIAISIHTARNSFCSEGPLTLKYLGNGTAVMYRFVRETLKVPLHRGLVEHPTFPENVRDGIPPVNEDKVTIGSRICIIYEALRDGRMRNVLVESLWA